MIELNAIYAAPAISKTERFNPTEILISLLDEQPDIDVDAISAKFYERVSDDEDYLRPIVKYFVISMMRNIDSGRRRNGKTVEQKRKERASRVAEIKQEASKIVEKMKSIVILDLVLPNGKTARASTCADCARAGGVFTKLSKLGRPRQIVGNLITDEQAQKLYK